MALSKTQVDKLGERLKTREPTELDLRELDEYRRSFLADHQYVVSVIQQHLGLAPTGRVPKTVPSIISKLRRESVRLTQIQDIAGCRIIVSGLDDQNRIVHELRHLFGDVMVVDRRNKPSYGYRAVHAIARFQSKSVEIQVRTVLQHQWAELSEQYADIVPGLKYGNGDAQVASLLVGVSDSLFEVEKHDAGIRTLRRRLEQATPGPGRARVEKNVAEFEKDHQELRNEVIGMLSDLHSLMKLIRSGE